MLKVSRQPSGEPEIFRSIQGEGVTAGTPSVFLRLATCNLACTWCDTKYTWDWANFSFDEQVMAMPVEDVEARLLSFDCAHLVVTGGEPLLQQKELAGLVTALSRRGHYCEIETNGTIAPLPQMAEAISQWNVSPKTSNSGNEPDRREKPDALGAFRELESAFFKFVVVDRADIDEVSRLVERHNLPVRRVLLMPEGVTASAIQERGAWLAEECARLGFRFSPRLHIMLWGDQRGK